MLVGLTEKHPGLVSGLGTGQYVGPDNAQMLLPFIFYQAFVGKCSFISVRSSNYLDIIFWKKILV